MSFNQSRADKSDGQQLRKSGRSDSFSQHRGYSDGDDDGGKGGGSAPSFHLSYSSSFPSSSSSHPPLSAKRSYLNSTQSGVGDDECFWKGGLQRDFLPSLSHGGRSDHGDKFGGCWVWHMQNAWQREKLLEQMICGLQRVGWKKVDVSFHSAFWPFFAHNNIHVKREWLHNAGAGVIAHVADSLKQQESHTFLAANL